METIIGRVLALVITALAVVGVYQVYSDARDNQNISDLQTQMAQIQQGVTTAYQRTNARYAFAAAPIPAATASTLGIVPNSVVTAFSAVAAGTIATSCTPAAAGGTLDVSVIYNG